MQSVRLNLGTYSHEGALALREQIRKYATLRKQKVEINFKGRGKKFEGFRDGNTKAEKLAVYIEVYKEDSNMFGDWELRNRVITYLMDNLGKNIDSKRLLHYGFKGLTNMSDKELVELLVKKEN